VKVGLGSKKWRAPYLREHSSRDKGGVEEEEEEEEEEVVVVGEWDEEERMIGRENGVESWGRTRLYDACISMDSRSRSAAEERGIRSNL